jgi:hypothetical protein
MKKAIAAGMAKALILSGLGFGLLVFSALFCHTAQAAGGSAGWVLTQRSKELGDQYVYLSPSGLKCVNPRQGVGIVTKAPNWNVSLYNERTRLYYSLTFDQWKKKLEARGRSPRDLSWRKGQSGHIAGLKATRYVMTNTAASGRHSNKEWVSADYWVADQIKAPAQLASMLTTTYGLPAIHGVPLRLRYTDASGRSETVLDTYQQQSTPVPDSYLACPSGYRLAKSEIEVMMTEENKQMVDDIAKDLSQEPLSLDSQRTSQRTDPRSVSDTVSNIRNNGLTLPNGQTVSKEEINKYIDAFKQYKQNTGR